MIKMNKMMVKNAKPQKQAKKQQKNPGTKIDKISRYIPIAQKRSAFEKTKGQCSHPNCNKPAEILHHKERFTTKKSHESITPLCKVHHEFAHNGITESISKADLLFRQYRQEALL
jgi:hypothetical protein